MASDDFNRANAGTLGANWTNLSTSSWGSGGFQIVGTSKATPLSGGGAQGAFRSAETFSADQYSQAVCADDPYQTGVMVRAADGGTIQGYLLATGRNAANMVLVSITNAGPSTTIVTFGNVYPVAGNTIRLEAQQSGLDVILRAFLDTGSGLVQIGTDYTDSTHRFSGGKPGIYGEFTNFDSFDSWNGGDLVTGSSSVSPSVSPSPSPSAAATSYVFYRRSRR